MMRSGRFSVLLLLLGVLTTFSPPSSPQGAEVKPGVVKIVVTAPAAKTGAGIVVRRDGDEVYIVTAAHVVDGADKISVQFRGSGKSWAAEVRNIEGENVAQGLALLRVVGSLPADVRPLPLATDVTLTDEERVTIIGHQASTGDWALIGGSVSNRKGRELVIQAPVQEQTSGGPVISNGRVVGLVQRRDPSGQFGYAVSALAIKEYVEGNQVSLAPARSTPSPPAPRVVVNGPKPLYAPFKTGDVFQECAECPEMVVIVPDPKGFIIGSPESEPGDRADQKQFGPIKFAKPYAIGKFEVTYAQFRASGVQRSTTCYLPQPNKNSTLQEPDQGPRQPVTCVSFYEVQEYLRWINRQVGASGKDAYRLPSEAEWEYAARGGTATARYWGNDPDQACDYANVADRTYEKTFPRRPIHECDDGFVYEAPVGSFKPNVFGLYDVIGNVWEWVQDCYAEQFSASIRDGSAFETQNCDWRVLRGGSYTEGPEYAHVAQRFRVATNWGNGFRLARTL